MNTTTVLIKENGLTTADGKGILPGSQLVIKADYIPPSWTGLYDESTNTGERSLVVATPGDLENEVEELRAANESIGQERARLLQENERLTADLDRTKDYDAVVAERDKLQKQVEDHKSSNKGHK